MPFGLGIARQSFQRFMDEVLAVLPGRYLDSQVHRGGASSTPAAGITAAAAVRAGAENGEMQAGQAAGGLPRPLHLR